MLETLTSQFYEIVIRSGNYTGFSSNISLFDFYQAMQDDSSEPVAILAGINTSSEMKNNLDTNYIDLDSNFKAGEALITNENNLEITGLAVFNNGYLIGELNAMDSICYLILKNKLQTAIVNIPDPFNDTKMISLSIVQSQKPQISVTILNGSPYIECNIRLNANILSLTDNSDYSNIENIETISTYFNSYMKSHINTFLYATAKSYNADIIGFGRYAIMKYLTYEEWYKQKWLANYHNSFFNVSIISSITNANLILKNN